MLNLQQMGIIIKNLYWSCSIVYHWKNKVTSTQEFQESLTFSVQILLSHAYFHLFIPSIIFFMQPCFSCKNNSVFQLQMWETLCTSFMHRCKHPFRSALPEWCNYVEKNHHAEAEYLISQSEISAVKNIPPSQEEIIFTCNFMKWNVFFNEKYHLNGFSSKHPVLAKRNKCPQIITLLQH